MKPLPPWHSSASTTKDGARLQFQNLASGVAMRAIWRCSASLSMPSTARATRKAIKVAASQSMARSARMFVIIG